MATITNLQIVLNTQKNPYLNQATQKNTCPNFCTQKNPEIENFKPIKILRSSLSLEIRSTPPPLGSSFVRHVQQRSFKSKLNSLLILQGHDSGSGSLKDNINTGKNYSEGSSHLTLVTFQPPAKTCVDPLFLSVLRSAMSSV